MVKVKQEMRVYEVDGRELEPKEEHVLRINSHWNRPEFIEIEMCGIRYTVAVKDIEAAIKNASNTARH